MSIFIFLYIILYILFLLVHVSKTVITHLKGSYYMYITHLNFSELLELLKIVLGKYKLFHLHMIQWISLKAFVVYLSKWMYYNILNNKFHIFQYDHICFELKCLHKGKCILNHQQFDPDNCFIHVHIMAVILCFLSYGTLYN